MRTLLRCGLTLALLVALSSVALAQCSVTTDKGDYAPGEIAYITGSGWQPGETVDLDLQRSCGCAPTDWSTTADADGNISTSYMVVDADLNVTFLLTATGETSGCVASTTFADSGNPKFVANTVYASDCTTAKSSFNCGETVCARAAGMGNNDSGVIEWWAPGATSPTRSTTFISPNGNISDSYAPTVDGTWTVKLYVPADTLKDTVSFSVSGCLTISCPVDTSAECGNTDPSFTGTATASSGTPTYSDSTTPGSCAGNYIISRTWSVTVGGNTKSCVQTIIVTDTSAPVISAAPPPVTVQCASDIPAKITLFATDNCQGTLTATATDGDPVGSVPCNYTILRSWTVSDSCGNAAAPVTQLITVHDTTAPVIDPAPAPVTVQCASDIPAKITLSATDNCQGTLTATATDGDPVGSVPCSYTILRSWNVSDSCGNAAAPVTQLITVNDTTAPAITCPSPITTGTDAGKCSAVVTGLDPTGISDNCSGTVTVTYALTGATTKNGMSTASGQTFNKGVTTVTYNAKDTCGNTTKCCFTVTVNDTEAPKITCPPAICVPADPGQCYVGGAHVTLGAPTVSDNCDLPAALIVSNNAPSTFLVGTTSVTWTVMDSAGKTATCAQTVNVKALVDIAYTGDTFVFTAGPNIGTAPVRLSAQLTPYPGCAISLTLATVRFEVFKSNNNTSTPDYTYQNVPVDASGNATVTPIQSFSVDSYRVDVRIEPANCAFHENAVEMATTCVDYGSTNKRTTGGGWIPNTYSINGKANFGFTANYNKNGLPKGNSIYMWKANDGYNYMVKITAWSGLTFFSDPMLSSFSGKGVVQQIDRSTGLVVASISPVTITVDVLDGQNGNPQRLDQYAIRVWYNGLPLTNAAFVYPSIPLGAGNISVFSK